MTGTASLDGIKIDPEIASLLPKHAPEEYAGLETLLQLEGCRDDVIVWAEQNVLLDGHTRLEICQRHGIPYRVRRVKLPSRELAVQWVIDNQLARRNLTDEQRAYFIGKEYLHKKQAKGGDKKPMSQNETLEQRHTAEQVADKHGVSRATVHRDAEFAQAVDAIGQSDPDQKQAILSGKSGKTKRQVVESRRQAPQCDRCRRVGAVPDCPACAAERAKADKAKKKGGKKKPAARAELKDALGTVIPPRCRDAYADTSLRDLLDEVEQAVALARPEPWLKRATKLADHYPFLVLTKFKDHAYEGLEKLQAAAEAVRSGVPYAVCPRCGGLEAPGKVCKSCRGCGLVPEHRYHELKDGRL